MGQGHPRREYKGGVTLRTACEDPQRCGGLHRCSSITSFLLRQRDKMHLFARLFFALDLQERERAHGLARAARVERAKRLADPAVLERAAHGDERVEGVVA